MKEVILKSDLYGKLQEMLKYDIDDLHCCEEYLAGYREALNEMIVYIRYAKL